MSPKSRTVIARCCLVALPFLVFFLPKDRDYQSAVYLLPIDLAHESLLLKECNRSDLGSASLLFSYVSCVPWLCRVTLSGFLVYGFLRHRQLL